MADSLIKAQGCLHFSEEALKKATNNFDQRSVAVGGCKLGEGGFGPVYKGKLMFTDVAIKHLRDVPKGDKGAQRLAQEQFVTEVKVLTCFRHPNLVTLIGYCSSPACLVYEFLPNGTLEDALEIGMKNYKSSSGRADGHRAKSSGIHLPWMCRISIATDTARGLSYLHTADVKPLVHRDVKSANVLLDLSFRAKVGDFGLARDLAQEEKELRTARVVGTSGYIPPEYYRGVITTKMDTFGFGVILLEMISGMPSYDPRRSPKDLISYMEADMEVGKNNLLCTHIDEHAGSWPSASFIDLFEIARGCVEPKMAHRPEMAAVYPQLERLMTTSAVLYAEEEGYRKTKTHPLHST